VSGKDPLRDEGIAFAQALAASGVDTELHTYSGLPHGFYSATTLQETMDYYERVVAFVKKIADDN
jgi:acetyl esterase